MNENFNIFINKKILIYGLGKSGISTFYFLKNYNNILLFDDNKKINVKKISNHIITSHNKIHKSKFDIIIISPGIDVILLLITLLILIFFLSSNKIILLFFFKKLNVEIPVLPKP